MAGLLVLLSSLGMPTAGSYYGKIYMSTLEPLSDPAEDSVSTRKLQPLQICFIN